MREILKERQKNYGIFLDCNNNDTITATVTTMSVHHLQQQNQGASVLIVPSSLSLTDDAYALNLVQVSRGETVTRTNYDAQTHTATSGTEPPPTPDGRFDSGIMGPAVTFEHTFTEAGEYLLLLSTASKHGWKNQCELVTKFSMLLLEVMIIY